MHIFKKGQTKSGLKVTSLLRRQKVCENVGTLSDKVICFFAFFCGAFYHLLVFLLKSSSHNCKAMFDCHLEGRDWYCEGEGL